MQIYVSALLNESRKKVVGIDLGGFMITGLDDPKPSNYKGYPSLETTMYVQLSDGTPMTIQIHHIRCGNLILKITDNTGNSFSNPKCTA